MRFTSLSDLSATVRSARWIISAISPPAGAVDTTRRPTSILLRTSPVGSARRVVRLVRVVADVAFNGQVLALEPCSCLSLLTTFVLVSSPMPCLVLSLVSSGLSELGNATCELAPPFPSLDYTPCPSHPTDSSGIRKKAARLVFPVSPPPSPILRPKQALIVFLLLDTIPSRSKSSKASSPSPCHVME